MIKNKNGNFERFDVVHSMVGGSIILNDDVFTYNDGQIPPTEAEIDAEVIRLQAEYPMQLLRNERDGKLKEEVDPKTCEAYNNGTQLSNEWKNYRQALLDMTLQTPTLDENGNLKAGLELDEIYWPTKPE